MMIMPAASPHPHRLPLSAPSPAWIKHRRDVGMGVTGAYLGARIDVLQSIAHVEATKDRWAALAAPTPESNGARCCSGARIVVNVPARPVRRHARANPFLRLRITLAPIISCVPSSPVKSGGWPIHAALVPLLDESNMREDRIVDRPPLQVLKFPPNLQIATTDTDKDLPRAVR